MSLPPGVRDQTASYSCCDEQRRDILTRNAGSTLSGRTEEAVLEAGSQGREPDGCPSSPAQYEAGQRRVRASLRGETERPGQPVSLRRGVGLT